jgi:hypothetical protein
VDEEAANELVGGERHALVSIAALDAVVLPLEGDASLVNGDQAAVGNGNAVGVTRQIGELGKSLELLSQIAPQTTRVAVMFNPDTYPYYEVHPKSFEAIANKLSLDLLATPARSGEEIDAFIARLGQRPGSAPLATPDPFMLVHGHGHAAGCVSSRGAHPSPADRAPRRLIEIVDARGVRFLGEERKNLSFRDRIAIRQIGHYGQGVDRPLVLRGVQTLPDFSYQALHLAHFFALCASHIVRSTNLRAGRGRSRRGAG